MQDPARSHHQTGDGYLRSLLILSARAVFAAATNKHDRLSRWAVPLAERRGYWKAVVAVAAKNVHIGGPSPALHRSPHYRADLGN